MDISVMSKLLRDATGRHVALPCNVGFRFALDERTFPQVFYCSIEPVPSEQVRVSLNDCVATFMQSICAADSSMVPCREDGFLVRRFKSAAFRRRDLAAVERQHQDLERILQAEQDRQRWAAAAVVTACAYRPPPPPPPPPAAPAPLFPPAPPTPREQRPQVPIVDARRKALQDLLDAEKQKSAGLQDLLDAEKQKSAGLQDLLDAEKQKSAGLRMQLDEALYHQVKADIQRDAAEKELRQSLAEAESNSGALKELLEEERRAVQSLKSECDEVHNMLRLATRKRDAAALELEKAHERVAEDQKSLRDGLAALKKLNEMYATRGDRIANREKALGVVEEPAEFYFAKDRNSGSLMWKEEQLVWEHDQLRDWVRTDRSTVKNAGTGVFASRAFRAGDLITRINGTVMKAVEARRLGFCTHEVTCGTYAVRLEDATDADTSTTGVGMYVNSADFTDKAGNVGYVMTTASTSRSKRERPSQADPAFYIQALVDIKQGQELLVSTYSYNYWAEKIKAADQSAS